MKKYLVTFAIVALAGCGSATKVATSGNVEDRRTPMTVPIIPTVATTEYVPAATTSVEYADLWESTDADSQLLLDELSDIADVMGDVAVDYDPAVMMIDCSTGVIRTRIAQREVDTYTGPNATALNRALDEYGAGFSACAAGDFEAGADHIGRGNILLEAVIPFS